MKKISEIPFGHKFNHPTKGECVVIDRTKRTITISYKLGTAKVTYKYSDSEFLPTDF